jgi:hypothetical protein
MAEETEKIILDIQFDTEQATKNSLELRKTLADLQAQQKSMKGTSDELTEKYIQNAVEVKRLTAEVRTNENQLLKAAQANKSASGSNNELRATLSVLTAQFNALSKEERTNTVAGQVLEKSIQNISNTLKSTEGAVGDFRRNVGDYEGAVGRAANSISGLRERIKELDDIIQNSDIGSQRFKDASDEAANLRLSIEQATGKVDEFGNREPKNPVKRTFEDALITVGLLGSGFQALSAQFEGNEDAQKKLATAAQGVNVALNLANIIKEKGAIIETLTLAKTNALTAATAAYTFVVGTSTGALKIFRLALATTGIGALVVGVGLLITNFDKVKEAVLRFIPGLAAVGEFISKATDAFLDFIGVTDDETKSLKNQETQVQKLINAETRRLDQAKQSFTQRKRLLEAAGKDTAALQIEEEKFFRDQALRQIKFIESQLGLIKTVSATAFAGAKAEIQRLQDEVANRTVEVTAIQIESAREAAEEAKKIREEQEKKEKEFTEKRLKEAKRIRDGLIAIQDDEDNARKEKEKKEDEQRKKNIEAAKAELSTLTVTTQEQLEARTLLRLTAAQANIDIAALEKEGILIQSQETALALIELEKTSGLEREQIVLDYNAFVEEQGDISFEKFLELQQAQVDVQNAAYEQQAAAAVAFGQSVTAVFEQSLTETGLDLQKFSRGVITLLLDTLQKTVNASLVEIVAKQVASKGVVGLATGAALSAAVNIAFSLAKSQINKPTPKAFARGVIGLEGAGTETSDSIPAYLSRGESVIPAWGTRAIQNMYPGFLENFVGSPKFRDGVIDFQPSVTAASDGNNNLIDAIRLLPAPIVRVADINKGQNDYAEVRLSGTI